MEQYILISHPPLKTKEKERADLLGQLTVRLVENLETTCWCSGDEIRM